MKIKEFIKPIFQFTVIVLISCTIVIGTILIVNIVKEPEFTIQEKIVEVEIEKIIEKTPSCPELYQISASYRATKDGLDFKKNDLFGYMGQDYYGSQPLFCKIMTPDENESQNVPCYPLDKIENSGFFRPNN